MILEKYEINLSELLKKFSKEKYIQLITLEK